MYIYFKVSFSRFYSGESIAILSITYIDGDIKKNLRWNGDASDIDCHQRKSFFMSGFSSSNLTLGRQGLAISNFQMKYIIYT